MKKLTALLMGTAMVLSLAACGGSASSAASSEAASSEAASSEETSEAASEETTDEAAGEVTTVNAGKLTMSTNAAFPPYEMTTDSGDLEGIDIEVAGAIAEKLGLELQVDDMDFDAALLATHGHGRRYRYRRAPEGHGLLRHLRRGHPVHHRARGF